MSQDKIIKSRNQAVELHNAESGIFQGRYEDFSFGRFTDEFIYGRYQVFEEVDFELENLPAGARVLDVGCGTGHFSNYIFNKGFGVDAIDPSIKMLEFARSNFQQINFMEGTATSLPFADNSFDLVISIEVLRYLDIADVGLAYSEMKRVLKPGGRLLVTHVNKYAADGYFIYYHLKQLILKATKKPLHACYFTTPEREIKLVSAAKLSSAKCVGRMFASIRIGYKFGKPAGRFYAHLLEVIKRQQKFYADPSRLMAGHLVITAAKSNQVNG